MEKRYRPKWDGAGHIISPEFDRPPTPPCHMRIIIAGLIGIYVFYGWLIYKFFMGA